MLLEGSSLATNNDDVQFEPQIVGTLLQRLQLQIRKWTKIFVECGYGNDDIFKLHWRAARNDVWDELEGPEEKQAISKSWLTDC